MPAWLQLYRNECVDFAGVTRLPTWGQRFNEIDGTYYRANLPSGVNCVFYTNWRNASGWQRDDGSGIWSSGDPFGRRWTLAITQADIALNPHAGYGNAGMFGLHCYHTIASAVAQCLGVVKRSADGQQRIALYVYSPTIAFAQPVQSGPIAGSPSRATPWLMRLYHQHNLSPVPTAEEDGRALSSGVHYAYYSLDGGVSWVYLGSTAHYTGGAEQCAGPVAHNVGNQTIDMAQVDAEADWFQIDYWGTDVSAPVLSHQDPAPGTSGVAPQQIVGCHVTDDGAAIALATVRIYVDEGDGEALAYDGSTDTWQAPYAGPSSAQAAITDGYSFTLQVARASGSWVPLSTVTIRVVAQNIDGSELDESWSFTIGDPAGSTEAVGRGPDWLASATGSNTLTGRGRLQRDETIASRARRRLMTRRGEWFADTDFGSRLHLLPSMKDAQRRVEDIMLEALQPMIDDDSVLEIIVGELSADYDRGALGVPVTLVVAGEQQVPLGRIPLS